MSSESPIVRWVRWLVSIPSLLVSVPSNVGSSVLVVVSIGMGISVPSGSMSSNWRWWGVSGSSHWSVGMTHGSVWSVSVGVVGSMSVLILLLFLLSLGSAVAAGGTATANAENESKNGKYWVHSLASVVFKVVA